MSLISTLHGYDTLEEALLENLNISRSQLKRRSDLKKTVLNRRVDFRDELQIPQELFNYGLVAPTYIGPDIEIIEIVEPFIILNKPTKIHSHPLHYNEQDNVLSFLRQSNLDLSLGQFNLVYDRGLLHRLDFETSGLMIYCKEEDLKREYLEHREKLIIDKTYFALIKPNILKPGFLYHDLDLSGDKVREVKNSSNSSRSVSLEVLEVIAGEKADLVKMKLFGGARHQIRAQLAFSGVPILGDDLYGGEKASRLFLHSYSYTIVIQGKAKIFKAKLPLVFGEFFDLDGIF